jgi:flagellar operon protein (TIGR03826 family)
MPIHDLTNCHRCGKLTYKTLQNICPRCREEIEEEYLRCARYLRQKQNRHATIHELSEATGVSEKQIIAFIREGRILTEQNPNLTYPCQLCQSPIQSGYLCQACANRIRKETEQAKTRDEPTLGAYYTKD